MFSVLSLFNRLLLLICLSGCSENIKTENTEILIDNIHKERLYDICPDRGLLGGVEYGGNGDLVSIRHCLLNESGWLRRVDFYSYIPCRGLYCVRVKSYYTYWESGWKVCHWSWDSFDEVYYISHPCQTFRYEFD